LRVVLLSPAKSRSVEMSGGDDRLGSFAPPPACSLAGEVDAAYPTIDAVELDVIVRAVQDAVPGSRQR
jgi:hypothetical protein